jgi:hypothetical protein
MKGNKGENVLWKDHSTVGEEERKKGELCPFERNIRKGGQAAGDEAGKEQQRRERNVDNSRLKDYRALERVKLEKGTKTKQNEKDGTERRS